jgi:hypothetical protein
LSRTNCVGWVEGAGAYVAQTMGAGILPPPPPPTRMLTFWTCDIFVVVLALYLAFFGLGAFVFFFGGMAVFY